jgi:hypothetical protein
MFSEEKLEVVNDVDLGCRISIGGSSIYVKHAPTVVMLYLRKQIVALSGSEEKQKALDEIDKVLSKRPNRRNN